MSTINSYSLFLQYFLLVVDILKRNLEVISVKLGILISIHLDLRVDT